MNSAEIFDSMKTLIGEINITTEEVEVSEGRHPDDPKYILDKLGKQESPFGNIKSPSYMIVANDGEKWLMNLVLFNGYLNKDFIEKYGEIDKAFDEAVTREAEFVKIGIRTESILPDYIDFIKTKYFGLRFDNEASRYMCDFAKVQIDKIDYFKEKQIFNLYYVLHELLEGSLERLAKNHGSVFASNMRLNSTDTNQIDSGRYDIEKNDTNFQHVRINSDSKSNKNLVSFRIRRKEVLSNENLLSIRDKMLRAKLIQKASLNQLLRLFSGEVITEKICWVKSVGSLHYFIDRLTNFPTPSFEKGVVHIEKNKWQIACACFTYRNKELSSRTLSRNKGPQSSKVKGDIDNIIKDLQ